MLILVSLILLFSLRCLSYRLLDPRTTNQAEPMPATKSPLISLERTCLFGERELGPMICALLPLCLDFGKTACFNAKKI